MPILVKDYHWSETESNAFITVPLKGVNRSKADIFCSEEFVKVSYPPFLFEAVLFEPIDDEKSTATIKDGCVVFNLLKKQPKIWSRIVSVHSDDKSFVLKKKKEAIDYAQKKAEELQKEKSAIKEKNKKYSIKEMMKLEEQDRSRIENIKESERVRMMEEFDAWKQQKRLEAEAEKLQLAEKYKADKLKEHATGCKITEIFDEDLPVEDDSCKIKQIVDEEDEKVTEVISKVEKQPRKNREKKVPNSKTGPRKAGKISVNFTPRVFPTPQRESKEVEENEWLQKQSQARKQFAIDDPDLAEHEKDPTWLKDKGGQLFASGNFHAAVNAYNLAIKIQPGMPILFLNRAACHLKLRNLYKCAEDCSTALDMMVPKVDANAKGRLKGHLRRAAAFCELELYVEALQDYEAALKIEPRNEKLIEDAEKIRAVIQSSS